MPFIIAEMSGNHNGSLERALQIVEAAAAAGARGFKLQTYTADTMTLNLFTDDFMIKDPDSPWFGRNLYELYGEAHTPWDWHEPIFARCRELGLVPFSTPFDETAVDFLEGLGNPVYKIASFENGDLSLIRYVAATKKPVIMSLGMIGLDEIAEAVEALEKGGCPEVTLLKCTSTYPASPENSNLLTMADLKARFPRCKIGLSDHTLGIGVALGAVALGAEVIEKHFTLSRADGGVDSSFSMEPAELKQLVEEAERVKASLGQVTYELSEAERRSTAFRRSIYVSEPVKKGEILSRKNVRRVRPGFGLEAKFYEDILGKAAAQDLPAGTPLKWEHMV
jgi:pseudaminic acid synthase